MEEINYSAIATPPVSKIDTTSAKFLSCEKLKKRYPIGEREVEILHGMDLDIEQGEFVMLIGPSGCGKSTFMYILFGLEPASEGIVHFQDRNINNLSDEDRCHLRNHDMTMVHQQPIWIKALTVAENVAFPLFLQRVPRKKAVEQAMVLLDVLNLTTLGEKHPHELSVGEQQRCSFMRALITDPVLVFADEPTGALDTDASIVVMELFKKINVQLGKTIVMVTHNLSHLPYATKVVSMLDGKIENIEKKSPASTAYSDKRKIIEVISTWKGKVEPVKAEDEKVIAPIATPADKPAEASVNKPVGIAVDTVAKKPEVKV